MSRVAAAAIILALVFAFVLALLVAVPRGEEEATRLDLNEDAVVGVYGLHFHKTLREFLRALKALEVDLDGEPRGDSRWAAAFAPEAKEAWVVATRRWAAVYTSSFRLELGEARHANLAFPILGMGKLLATGMTWELREEGVRLTPNALGARSGCSVAHADGGLYLSSWRVSLPWPPSGGRCVRMLRVNLVLHKQ